MFNPNASATPAATATNARGNFEPAIAFLNLYLPSKDGQRVKLGAIPLKASKDREASLVEALKANPELTAAIISKLELDFQLVTTGEGTHFDL
jgi:hypothetical protein